MRQLYVCLPYFKILFVSIQIQVIEDDRKHRSGLFQSTPRGAVPPLVTTPFVCEDQGSSSFFLSFPRTMICTHLLLFAGNANPRFIRSTMYNIPYNNDMMKQSHVPFALSITPFAKLNPKEVRRLSAVSVICQSCSETLWLVDFCLQTPPPVVDLGQLGPVRCNRCKAYICPYMQFTDGGRRFLCSFCGCSTEGWYSFQYISSPWNAYNSIMRLLSSSQFHLSISLIWITLVAESTPMTALSYTWEPMNLLLLQITVKWVIRHIIHSSACHTDVGPFALLPWSFAILTSLPFLIKQIHLFFLLYFFCLWNSGKGK